MQTHDANMWTSEAEFNNTHHLFQIKCVKEKTSMQTIERPFQVQTKLSTNFVYDYPLFPNPVDIIY